MIVSHVATMLAPVFVAVALFAPSAFAQVHRCTDASGKVIFSDQKCGGATKGGEITVRPNELDTSANREALLRNENAELRGRIDRAEEREANVSSTRGSQGSGASREPRPDSMECQAARRSYETATSSINPNDRDIDSRRSAMYVACNAREPNRTTVIVAPSRRNDTSNGIRRRCVDNQDYDCIRTGVSR